MSQLFFTLGSIMFCYAVIGEVFLDQDRMTDYLAAIYLVGAAMFLKMEKR